MFFETPLEKASLIGYYPDMDEKTWTDRFHSLASSLDDPGSPLARQIRFFREVPADHQSLLDIGCAWGWIPMLLSRSGIRTTAIDWDEERIGFARRKAGELGIGTVFETADAVFWSPETKFSCVRAGFMLDHLTSRLQTVNCARRFADWVAPGGGLFMSFCGPGDDLDSATFTPASDGTLAFHTGPHAGSHWRYWSDSEIDELIDHRRFLVEAIERDADNRGARFVYLRRR